MLKEDIFENTGYSGDKRGILNSDYKLSELMEQAVKVVNTKIAKKRRRLSLKQFLDCVEEVYIHALQKGGVIDEVYVDWLIGFSEG